MISPIKKSVRLRSQQVEKSDMPQVRNVVIEPERLKMMTLPPTVHHEVSSQGIAETVKRKPEATQGLPIANVDTPPELSFQSMRPILKLISAALCSLLLVMSSQRQASAQSSLVDVDQTTVQFAKVTDKRLIKLFLDDFMIPDDGIASLQIYDLNSDGFGEGDLVQTYPSGKVYLTTPTPKVQRLMNDWSFGGNIKFTARANDDPDRFENAPDTVRAMGGIFASMLRGIRRNYNGKPIKMYLEQNNDVTSVQIWGYDPKLMRYQPLPVNKVPEEVPVMKLIYLEKTVVDSVFTGSSFSRKQ